MFTHKHDVGAERNMRNVSTVDVHRHGGGRLLSAAAHDHIAVDLERVVAVGEGLNSSSINCLVPAPFSLRYRRYNIIKPCKA